MSTGIGDTSTSPGRIVRIPQRDDAGYAAVVDATLDCGLFARGAPGAGDAMKPPRAAVHPYSHAAPTSRRPRPDRLLPVRGAELRHGRRRTRRQHDSGIAARPAAEAAERARGRALSGVAG